MKAQEDLEFPKVKLCCPSTHRVGCWQNLSLAEEVENCEDKTIQEAHAAHKRGRGQ